jgi:hypothetical protein
MENKEINNNHLIEENDFCKNENRCDNYDEYDKLIEELSYITTKYTYYKYKHGFNRQMPYDDNENIDENIVKINKTLLYIINEIRGTHNIIKRLTKDFYKMEEQQQKEIEEEQKKEFEKEARHFEMFGCGFGEYKDGYCIECGYNDIKMCIFGNEYCGYCTNSGCCCKECKK